jgi:cell division protein FtsX
MSNRGRLRWRRVAAVLLGLVAAGLTGCTSTVAPTPTPPDPLGLVVYLRSDVTTAQKKAIEARLRALPNLVRLSFETKEQAYQRFKEIFKDEPELVEQVQPGNLPESFQITLSGGAAEPVIAELRRLAGVETVTRTGARIPTPVRTS